jgi:hypothetical protein
MKYSHDFSEAILLGRGGSQYEIPKRVKPEKVGLDTFLGAVMLVLCVLFFVYWFGAKLRRASKGDLRENRPWSTACGAWDKSVEHHQENQIGCFTAIRSNGREETVVIMQDYVDDMENGGVMVPFGDAFLVTGSGLDVVRLDKGKYQIVDSETVLLTSDDPSAV